MLAARRSGSTHDMRGKEQLRAAIKGGRKSGAIWVRLLDLSRLFLTAERRASLWTRIAHRHEVHQTTPYTREERYPALFDLAASLAPDAKRILSFGCSTGEELAALRRRFPDAEIIGAEINPRSRRIAARRGAADPRMLVLHPRSLEGSFDIVFALAVLQREPHKIAEMRVENLSPYYPHRRFDSALRDLSDRLKRDGLLCVANAHYRVEDSSVAGEFEPNAASPFMAEPIFGPDGRLLHNSPARTLFRKR